MAVTSTLTEREFSDQVKDLARIYSWKLAHFRPAQTRRGWRTPVEGELGKGWPDWVLVRERDRRIVFAELKREGKQLEPDQVDTLGVLRSLETPAGLQAPLIRGHHVRVDVVVWRPGDFDSGEIVRVLR